ncbi:MAG TPA: carotenoid oxygenase family protein [Acidimicrobiia bacterium]|nr:carotenoid oxygenase family protein [Acidimicrobiia bacterium]
MDTLESNPYLAGNFAPVRDERDDDALDVTGAIPPELTGLLLRNGPNPILDPDPAAYHWFLGDGMLHGIELAAGNARYRNRWVRTADACAALGEPAPLDAPPAVNDIGAKANTHVVAHAGRIYALVESSLPTEVRPDLSTVGARDFDGRLTSAFTAHPKIDPISGEMHLFGYDFMGPPFLRYHVVDAKGALSRTEEIDLPGPVMMHDFAITASSVVWLDLPVVFDVSTFGTRPFPFVWRPEHGARVGVMPRLGGNADVIWIEIEPCYVYHPLNAYDDADGNVVLDLVKYPDMFASELYGPGASAGTRLERWTIDARAGRVATELLDDASQEFPRVDDRQAGRVHRYGYATEAGIGEHWVGLGSLRKHDLVRGTVERHDVGAGAAGEPVFVPSAPDAGEDEGWVLSVVYDAARDASDVRIIDATDFAAAPVATVHLPRRVPYGFHGSWVEGASLD